VLAVLLIQMVRATRRTELLACKSNLQRVSLAQLAWVNDSEVAGFPGEISTNRGGTMEYLQKGELFQHFRKITNELAGTNLSPKVLTCPSDDRKAATNFATLANSNLSYFVNRGPTLFSSQPTICSDGQQVVLGDRNVTNNNQLGWSPQMHNRWKGGFQSPVGNIAELNGSVRSVTIKELREALSIGSSRLALP
jgi:hypothetical protein